MSKQLVTYHAQPRLNDGVMLIAFDGWMDGAEVSTGTVEWFVTATNANLIAEIEPEPFYMYNFPGNMETSSMFRPSVDIQEGLVVNYQLPTNHFYVSTQHNLIMFIGREPNMNWTKFSEAMLDVIDQCNIKTIYFVGSVGGVVPHTRQPRFHATLSDASLKGGLKDSGVRFTEYEGPASFVSFLMQRVADIGLSMMSLVAEIPAYIHGPNPKCIAAVIKKVSGLMGQPTDMAEFNTVTEQWEKRLTEALEEHTELLEHIEKLEADYDNEIFDTQMGDLKQWLQERGIRVD